MTETDRLDGDVAVCPRCTEQSLMKRRTREILMRDLAEASVRSQSAREAFISITGNPSGLPHPDGAQHIHTASRAVTIARMDLLRAHHRLSDFLNTGLVPDDLMSKE